MTGKLRMAGLVGLVLFALVIGAQSGGPRSDGDRIERLTEQLRCPVCDGLAVADSPSSTARAIAGDIRRRVADGQTDEEIRGEYVAQYGQWILLEPPTGGIGTIAWLLPVVLVVGASGAAVWTVYRRSIGRAQLPSPSARTNVAEALRTQEGA